MAKILKRLYFQHGAYYYVHQGKWKHLSKDYGEALRLYSSLISSGGIGMPALLDRHLSQQKDVIAASTYANYVRICERLKKVFEQFSPDQVMPKHVFSVRNEYRKTPSMANHMLSFIKGAFQLAIEEGTINSNPAREVTALSEPKRDRYITDAEFSKIREHANPSMQSIMDVAYLTGQRISDVLKIQRRDLMDEGISIVQSKTGAKLIVGWSPELTKAIEDAKRIHQSVKGLHLFHKRNGEPYAYRTVFDFWDRARIKAGLKDCRIHDLRAKAGTDARKNGQDSKALLGHKSDQAHARYIRDKDTPIVSPVGKV